MFGFGDQMQYMRVPPPTDRREITMQIAVFGGRNIPGALDVAGVEKNLLGLQLPLDLEIYLNRKETISIVGTRDPSEYGFRCAERFGFRLAEKKIIVG